MNAKTILSTFVFYLSTVCFFSQNGNAEVSRVGIASYGDVKFAEKRPNGNYNVICQSGSLEFDVTIERLISGRTCVEPYISVSKSTFKVGEPVVVYYSNLPKIWNNWVGIFFDGYSHEDYLDYFYTESRQQGHFNFVDLSAGLYQARSFYDDSYDLEQELTFTIID
jgi:hypothetical protein